MGSLPGVSEERFFLALHSLVWLMKYSSMLELLLTFLVHQFSMLCASFRHCSGSGRGPPPHRACLGVQPALPVPKAARRREIARVSVTCVGACAQLCTAPPLLDFNFIIFVASVDMSCAGLFMLHVVGPAKCVCCKCYRPSLIFLRTLKKVLGGVSFSSCLLIVLCLY